MRPACFSDGAARDAVTCRVVEHSGNPPKYRPRGFKRLAYPWGDPPHYVLSECDAVAKFTHECMACIALLLAGRDQEGNEVSMMGHLSPAILQASFHFRAAFRRAMVSFDRRTVEEGREALISGGSYDLSLPDGLSTYVQMTECVGAMAQAETGTECSIVTPPKMFYGNTDVYYATPERSLTVRQTAQPFPVEPIRVAYHDVRSWVPSWMEQQGIGYGSVSGASL